MKRRGNKMRMPQKLAKKSTKKTTAKRPARKGARAARSKPRVSQARRITGTVNRIVKGKHTDEKLSAEQAFSDPEQAAAQVEWAESNGTREMIRLTRLAYRQYQGKRYRAPASR
jgi:hypothetical protein